MIIALTLDYCKEAGFLVKLLSSMIGPFLKLLLHYFLIEFSPSLDCVVSQFWSRLIPTFSLTICPFLVSILPWFLSKSSLVLHSPGTSILQDVFYCCRWVQVHNKTSLDLVHAWSQSSPSLVLVSIKISPSLDVH